jgi:hypothetical protein
MFMTTHARFAPAGSPSNPRAPRALVNPTDKVPHHWNRTSPLTNNADFTKEYDLHQERITLPTTFNAK